MKKFTKILSEKMSDSQGKFNGCHKWHSGEKRDFEKVPFMAQGYFPYLSGTGAICGTAGRLVKNLPALFLYLEDFTDRKIYH